MPRSLFSSQTTTQIFNQAHKIKHNFLNSNVAASEEYQMLHSNSSGKKSDLQDKLNNTNHPQEWDFLQRKMVSNFDHWCKALIYKTNKWGAGFLLTF